MKISDLIKKLENIQKKNGDLTVIARSNKYNDTTHTTEINLSKIQAYEIDSKRKLVKVLLVGKL